MTVLTVGAGQQYSTVAGAVAATQDGDTVLVQAGTYLNDFVTVSHKITMQSVGGLAILASNTEPPNGKAILTADQSCTIDGFGFTGAVVGDNNGAGIRYEGGDLVVKNSLFWNNQDGLLGNADPNGTITIDHSEFSGNGAGDGYSHNIYIGNIASATIENSYFHDAVVGHEIKSRAQSTTIVNNRIFDNAASDSYSIDLPNAGRGVIQGNIIEKGANAQNWTTIHYGGESAPYPGSSLSVTGNTIVNDNPNGILLTDSAGSTPAVLSGNQIWGYAAGNIVSGSASVSGNTTLAARPTLDLTSVAPMIVLPVIPPAPMVDPASTHLVNFGAGGAVAATGHILTVGAGGRFATLGEALAASADGDTIAVRAGTYVNDFGTVHHKVIIEGVGGIARFVQQNEPSADNGILVIDNDATLKNLEFSGAANYSGHEGGVTIAAGNVTIYNSLFDGNQIGVRALDNASESVSIYNSEIGPNGNADKATHNVNIGRIGSFTMVGSYVHGATTGHEVYDLAYNSDIEGNRIIDGAGVGASFGLDLGQGGNAVIAGNIIDKGPNAANGVLVHVGGEGATYDNSNVRITGNTLVSDVANVDHPYTFFIVGDAARGSAVPLVWASGNVFVGGVAGSPDLIAASGDGGVHGSRPVLDTSSPVSASVAPAAFSAVSGPSTLTLMLTETKQDVDAQFLVSVDGAVVGGGLVTADDSGTAQAISFQGNWAAGAHNVVVTGLNLDWHGGPSAADLTVRSISFGDTPVQTGSVLVSWSPSMSATVTAPAPVAAAPPFQTPPTGGAIVLHVSEDAYLGDAQFTVAVDGKQVGGTMTATASAARGETQAITLPGIYGFGTHDVAVSFINDAWGGAPGLDRNLYVNSIDFAGVANRSAQANLYSNYTADLSVHAPAPPTHDTLVVHLAEDAYAGDAQFVVSMDGRQLGTAQSVTASYAAGQGQDFTFNGSFGVGAHDFAVTFLNDAYAGSGSDRNLYLLSVDYNGTHYANATAPLYSNGSLHYTLGHSS